MRQFFKTADTRENLHVRTPGSWAAGEDGGGGGRGKGKGAGSWEGRGGGGGGEGEGVGEGEGEGAEWCVVLGSRGKEDWRSSRRMVRVTQPSKSHTCSHYRITFYEPTTFRSTKKSQLPLSRNNRNSSRGNFHGMNVIHTVQNGARVSVYLSNIPEWHTNQTRGQHPWT